MSHYMLTRAPCTSVFTAMLLPSDAGCRDTGGQQQQQQQQVQQGQQQQVHVEVKSTFWHNKRQFHVSRKEWQFAGNPAFCKNFSVARLFGSFEAPSPCDVYMVLLRDPVRLVRDGALLLEEHYGRTGGYTLTM